MEGRRVMAAKIDVVVSPTFFKRIADRMATTVEQRATVATRELIADLERVTPVDTGYARSRWRLDTVPNSGLTFKVSYSPYLFNLLSKDFVVSNDADYIKYLNAGSSIQAPAYFVEQAILNNGFKLNSVLVNSP
jgi:hypothetical protein